MDDCLATVKSLVSQPYAIPILLVVLVVFYMMFRNSGGSARMVGGESTPTVTQKEPVTVVLFWSDGCGHCKVVKPVWDQLTTKYQDHPSIKLDDINCAQNQEIAAQYQIEGVPTIMKFCGQSQPKLYNGDRSQADLESFINSDNH